MRLVSGLIALACIVACDAPPPLDSDAPSGESMSIGRDVGPERSGQRKIVAFGDSLTAGFGIGQNEAYPAALQQLVDDAGLPYEVINAGVSGETTAGGVRRLDWVLEDRDVAAFVLALGGNDGLRGLPPSEMKKNLSAIIDDVEGRGIPVLLAGLGSEDAPDDRYIRDLLAVYGELAAERDVAFVPNLLDGVLGDETLNQADGKHPNPAGARVVADNVWTVLKPMLQ